MVKLSEAKDKADLLSAYLWEMCEKIQIAGSIRRGNPDVKDIELVVIPKIDRQGVVEQSKAKPKPSLDKFLGITSSKKKEKVVKEVHITNRLFERLDFLVENNLLKVGDKQGPKYRKYIFDNVPVDLFLADSTNWGYILLLRTGSAAYSKQFVTEIKIQGKYQVSGGYVYPKKAKYFDLDNVIPIASEKELYELLKFPYKMPRNRIKGIF